MTAGIPAQTPVLIGVGQTVHRDGDSASTMTPARLAVEAVGAALDDTGAGAAVAAQIDTLCVVRLMQDSAPRFEKPFGTYGDLPATVAEATGLAPAHRFYSEVGGDQPQKLVNEFAAALSRGECRAVLLTGAEATASMKAALRASSTLDWTDGRTMTSEDRGLGSALASDAERSHGMVAPVELYQLFDNALRTRMEWSRDDWRARAAQRLSAASEVAAAHPHAQFNEAREPGFFASEENGNFAISDLYLKWHVAQDAVNQGAALVLTTYGAAQEMGIDPSKMVFLHAHGAVQDHVITERRDLSRSAAIGYLVDQVFSGAGKTPAELDLLDIYDCFPCVPYMTLEAMNLPADRLHTVTGGLPAFGGAGNNYSMHAIATMAEKLRAAPGSWGAVLANGGYMSKFALGLWSTEAPADWRPAADLQPGFDAAHPSMPVSFDGGDFEVESYLNFYDRSGPLRGVVLGQAGGTRKVAQIPAHCRTTLRGLLAGDGPIGTKVRAGLRDGKSTLLGIGELFEAEATGIWTRPNESILLRRDGHLLEITINRPHRHNALFSAAHFELHEALEAYQSDPDLWCAIITGVGEKAFCSGNDLKVTQEGGDMTLPPSGFAALSRRAGREKPLIAAINGVAVGGGTEIALACDIVISVPYARFGLPEVKVGLMAAAGGIQKLTSQIGEKAAMELILTGRLIQAEEALSLGLINSIAEGDVLEAAREKAEEIMRASPSAVRASKRVLNALRETPEMMDNLSMASAEFRKLRFSNDGREGMTAFVEKRTPKWTNS